MNIGTDSEMLQGFFLGEYSCVIDKQRRLAVPRPWRGADGTPARFFLLPGRGKSLQLVPAAAFQELLLKLRKVSFADAGAARALATIGSMAQECVCDRQGRINMTQRLMEHANLDAKAVLVGAVTTVQVWNPDDWEKQRMDSEACLDAIQGLQEKPDDFMESLRQVVRG